MSTLRGALLNNELPPITHAGLDAENQVVLRLEESAEALFGAFTNLMGGLEWETRISTNRVNKTNITSEISQTVDNQQQNGGLVVTPKTANVSQKIISPQIKVLVEKRIRQDPKAYFEGFSQETRKSLLKGLNPALATLF